MKRIASVLYGVIGLYCFVYFWVGGPHKYLYYGFAAMAFSVLYEIAANTEKS